MPFFQKPTQGLPNSKFQPIKPFCEMLNFSFPPIQKEDAFLGVGYDQSPFLRNDSEDEDMFIMLKDILLAPEKGSISDGRYTMRCDYMEDRFVGVDQESLLQNYAQLFSNTDEDLFCAFSNLEQYYDAFYGIWSPQCHYKILFNL